MLGRYDSDGGVTFVVANLTVQIFLSQTAINILMGKNTKCAHPGNDHHKNICKRIQSSTMWSFDDSIHLEQGWWAGIKIRLAGPVCSHHRGCHREAHRCRACRSPSLRSTQEQRLARGTSHTSHQCGNVCDLIPELKWDVDGLVEVRWTGLEETQMLDRGPQIVI